MGRDWTRDEDYAEHPQLDDSGLAWEFLRRNPKYAVMAAEGADVSAWGLVAAIDPSLSAEEAAPLWRWDFAPAVVVVLGVCRRAVRSPQALSFAQLASEAATVRRDDSGVHLRLPNGLQAFLPASQDQAGALAAVLPLDAHFLARASAARVMRAGAAGHWPRISALSAPRRARLALTLRALDAREAGASYREIARGLLRAPVSGSAEWRMSSGRAVVIRLCAVGRRLVRGGYLTLLRGRTRTVSGHGA